MIIRLTASCNNRCFFCLVEDEIMRHDFRPLAELVAEIDTAPPDEVIDIFGGEPTIDPIFWEVLTHALSSGREVTLASNVRLFSHRPAAERLREVGDGRLYVRTTLMGPTPELHDRLNGVRQSAFLQTVQGIRNLSALGVDVQTNIVILAENIDALLATALVALEAGSRQIKFSGAIRTSTFLNSIAPPELIRARLRTIVPLLRASGATVKLEKLTPCLAGDFLDILNRETDPSPVSDAWYRKVPACSNCSLVTSCCGAEKGALQRYGEGWVQPLPAVPEALVEEIDIVALPAYQPRRDRPFVRISFPEETGDALEMMGSVAAFVNRYPHVYVLV